VSLHPECELTSKALFSFWKSKALQLVFNRMRTYGVMTSSKGEGKQHATSPRKSQMAQSLRYKVRVSTKMRIKNIIGRQIQFYVALDERVLRSDAAAQKEICNSRNTRVFWLLVPVGRPASADKNCERSIIGMFCGAYMDITAAKPELETAYQVWK